MTLNITDNAFNTTGANRNFVIGADFGTDSTTVARISDNATFYPMSGGAIHMAGVPKAWRSDDLGYLVSPLEGRAILTGSTTTSTLEFINSNASFLSRTGLYNGFHLEYNASYFNSSYTLLHVHSGFIYGGIQVNGNTVTLRNITKTNLYASSTSLDTDNITVTNTAGDVYLNLSSFTSAPANNITVWTYTGWEYVSGYF